MLGKGQELLRHGLYFRLGKAGVGAEHRRGQHTAADAHGREDGQGNGETAFTHAGEILN